jgi:HPt (histidine-containing phosphotransfer) domain-containing protein
MDVRMPEMDGLEATRNILQRWPGPDRPRIIAMTAGATEADREACLAAGMDDYVSKPIRREELAAALARSTPVGAGERVRNGDEKVRSSGPNVRGRRSNIRRSGPNVRSTGQATIDMEGLNRLRETVGGEEALQEVMTTFIDDTERVLAALRSDVGAGRAAEVRRHAHSLKSTAASFGATGLSELCRRLEELGLAGDLDGAAALVADIATEFARVRQALRPEISR